MISFTLAAEAAKSKSHRAIRSSERKPFGRNIVAFRSPTLSTQIVAQVRDALFAKELRPGDFLGTEKDLAERFGVSRIVARDALRTLEAQGIVDIKVGSGGGARIAQGNARLFAEALAVQLELAGVSAAEIMDAQRAIDASPPSLPPSTPPPKITPGCATCSPTPSARSTTCRRSRAQATNSISRWPKRRTIARWSCSSSHCSTYRGRRRTRR